ncbi:complex I NDUFA9 subunit family protein [Deinococcus petrolearius]|uniref:Complex I NDUFA9 subunit family protein n=1 Tax=Deinococcus petrolearius TaxID=1751295 RepID=A0ABW1DJP0_9DEIO
MTGLRVLVSGAGGFVGRAVVAELLRRGHTVFAGARRGEAVGGAPGQQAQGVKLDVTDAASALRAVQQTRPDAVVHLVGIIAQTRDQTFQAAHVGGTRHMLAATPRGARYLHMSALGADPESPSRYSATKGEAEALVRASGLDWTIFRPSLIFGPGDDFFGRVLKELVTTAPVVPQIGDGLFPFRPVSIGDVAQAFAGALTQPETAGQTYALTGPEEFTFRQLLDEEQRALGQRRPVVPVPLPLMDLAVPLMGVLPRPPITTDQYAMLKAGNTAPNEPARTVFGLPMHRLQDALPGIVKGGR